MWNADASLNPTPRQPHEAGLGGSDAGAGDAYRLLATQAISFETLVALACRMSDGVCFLTPDRRIRYANPAFRALLGRSEAELLGRRVDDFRATPAAGPTLDGQRVLICGWLRADGAVFEARCALEPLVEGASDGAALMLMTPTARLATPGDRAAPDPAAPADLAAPPAPAAGATDASVRQTERAAAARWVEVIEAVADVSLSTLSAYDLIEAMLNRIRPALDLENAAVLLLNAGGSLLEGVAMAGAGREFVREVRVPLTGPHISAMIATREPLVINGAGDVLRASGHFPEPLLAAMTVHSMVLLPLVAGDQVIGLLYLGACRQDHFTVDDIRLARVAAARVALAVDGARARAEAAAAHRRLVTLATDGLPPIGPTDHRVIASRLVTLVAPAFASAAALYLIEEDGAVRRAAHTAPAADNSPLTAAVSAALDQIPTEMERFTPAAELQAALTGGAAGAIISLVPVESHGHAVGALYLIEAGQRPDAAEDMTLVRELARRSAVGMEIARLYAELEDALKRGGETLMQLDTIFEATDAGIFVTDAHGRYQRLNAYGARLLGMSEQPAASGDPPAAFEFRDEQGRPIPSEEEPAAAARARNEAVERRIVIHRFDTGLDTPALARCAPLHDGHGHVTGAVGVLMDITGIQEIERQKDEFLGIVSHELKTPLTTLKILAQMLAKRMRQSEESRALEQAERMTTAIVRMERLISDLLDVSRIHEGKLELAISVSDLGAICRDAVREQEIISQRNIVLSLPDRESLPVHADMERLRQVVVNLLSNALKYSPANSPVSLRVREAGEMYHVAVEDHGPGLEQEARRRLFQRFYRAPGVHVQSGSGVGLGLGLFISREIVLAHDGDIWVDSEPGHGSVFTFSIPRADSGAQDSGAS